MGHWGVSMCVNVEDEISLMTFIRKDKTLHREVFVYDSFPRSLGSFVTLHSRLHSVFFFLSAMSHTTLSQQ